VDPFIGVLLLEEVCNETLAAFVRRRKEDGVKPRTIAVTLQRVARIDELQEAVEKVLSVGESTSVIRVIGVRPLKFTRSSRRRMKRPRHRGWLV
jgi:hypothetical protein